MNINYLFQLRTYGLVEESFTDEEKLQLNGADFKAFTNLIPPSEEDANRATHTHTDNKGPALGPKKFVQKVVHHYTQFIERELVNGPVGQKLKDLAEQAKSPHHRGGPPSTSRILVAGALPPMVKDQHLWRIQAKYVDQHADGPDAGSAGKTWGPSKSPTRVPIKLAPPLARPEELALDRLSVQDSPQSSASTRTSGSKTGFEENLSDSLHSSVSSNLITEASAMEKQEREKEILSQKTFESMLQQVPSICDLPTRVGMIDDFNTQLRAFCELHPDVLRYIEINDTMRQAHPDRLIDVVHDTKCPSSFNNSSSPSGEANAESTIKGIPVIEYYASQAEGDGANVHPTWERTYTLWLDKFREMGVDVDSFPPVDQEELERGLREYTEQKGDRLLTSKYRTAS